MRALAGVLLMIVLIVAPAAFAPISATSSGSSSPKQSSVPSEKFPVTSDISIDASGTVDAKIKKRLEGIFAQTEGTSKVTIDVKDGVVTLDGEVVDAKSENVALQIASRVDGVVWVSNEMSRAGGVEVWKQLLESVQNFLSTILGGVPNVIAGLVVGSGVVLFCNIIARRKSFWERTMPNKFVAVLVASGIRFFGWLGGIVTALQVMGASALLSAFLGGAGVIGIAVGFSLRDTVENYLASLMLSIRQPFKANDHVVIDGQEGRVVRLTNRSTVLMTLDGNQLRLPNSDVFKASLLNYSRNPERRFDFRLGVDTDDDIDAARKVGLKAIKAQDFILDDPGPQARVIEVGDSNVVVEFLAWIDQTKADWHKARTQTILAVKSALEDGGFGMPEPIYRLRVDPRSNPLPFKGFTVTEGDEDDEDSKSEGGNSDKQKDAGLTKQMKRQVHNQVRQELKDVAPDKDIDKMVDKERATDSDEDDLLDEDDDKGDQPDKAQPDKDAA